MGRGALCTRRSISESGCGSVSYTHLDAQGRKMAKSVGNGIDPLEIIDQYGADALRLRCV